MKDSKDRGDSELVSLVLLIPLIVGILFTMIDMSVYFSNRAQIQSAARDAARTVAIMGGNGTSLSGTPIEVKYGSSRQKACEGLATNERTKKAYSSASTVSECHAMQSYAKSAGLVNVEIESLKCTPTKTDGVGVKTQCVVKWKFGHVPGSPLGFVKTEKGLAGTHNTTVGTSESEVNMTGIQLVPRSSV